MERHEARLATDYVTAAVHDEVDKAMAPQRVTEGERKHADLPSDEANTVYKLEGASGGHSHTEDGQQH